MPALKECFISTVRDISSEGSGVVQHPGGKTFFVPGVWVGETGEFRITGFKGRYGFAELVSLHEKSPHRIDAACEHHGFRKGKCGGCPWQFISYPEQLNVKQLRVRKLLGKIDKNLEKIIKPAWGSPEIFGYRNRAQFKTDGEKIGYVTAGSRDIAPIVDCLILNEKNRHTLRQLLRTFPRQDLKPKRTKNRSRNRRIAEWNTLDIDDEISAAEIAVNQRRPFRQGNSAQNRKMRQWLQEKLEAVKNQKNKSAKVVEFFAGSGNFTEVISAAGFENILALEGADDAVEELAKKQIPAVRIQRTNLFLPEKVAGVFRQNPDAEILVLDPPRDGFKGIDGLFAEDKKMSKKLTDIFYISCNPATFVRDAEILYREGFSLREVQPLDQFPHTPHIELLAHLVRCRGR